MIETFLFHISLELVGFRWVFYVDEIPTSTTLIDCVVVTLTQKSAKIGVNKRCSRCGGAIWVEVEKIWVKMEINKKVYLNLFLICDKFENNELKGKKK